MSVGLEIGPPGDVPAVGEGVAKSGKGRGPTVFVKGALLVLPLAFLWFRLIDNLRLEWTTNPTYAYGWVVPVLCLGLLLRRWQAVKDHGLLTTDYGPRTTDQGSQNFSFLLSTFCFAFCAFLYLPTRLIEGATPEWRPIQWSLAVITVGLTLVAVYAARGRSWLREAAFPVTFFLVAIPWPTMIESPIIQGLTQANSSWVIEVLGIMGIPAMQHGNLIEVGTGTVGVDEACSGIRSFQSSLMISLFIGEFYRFGLWRRLFLVPLAFLVAFGFNVCRTTILTWIAAKKGVAAIAEYHDQAGVTILFACTATMWGVAWGMHRREGKSRKQKAENRN